MQKPTITNASPMNGPAQIGNVADFAEQGWRFRSGTASARGTLPTAEKFEGLTWQDTDSGKSRYIYQGGAWVFDGQTRQTTAGLDYPSGGVFGNAAAMRIAKRDSIVYCNLALSKAYAYGDGDQPGIFPTGFRPAVEVRGAGQFAGSGTPVAGFFSIATNGQVTLSGAPGTHTLFFAVVTFETP